MKTKVCCHCKVRKNLSLFSWKNRSFGLYSKECKDCHKKWRDKNYKKNKSNDTLRALQRKKMLKEWLDGYKKGLKCSECSENHPSCLHFHHRDPKTKDIAVSACTNAGYSVKRILKEISKCEVLCANCHAKHHWKERNKRR